MGEFYKYSKNDNIIRDSYANKRMELSGISEIELLKLLKEKSMLISMNDTHKVNDIAGVCYEKGDTHQKQVDKLTCFWCVFPVS